MNFWDFRNKNKAGNKRVDRMGQQGSLGYPTDSVTIDELCNNQFN